MKKKVNIHAHDEMKTINKNPYIFLTVYLLLIDKNNVYLILLRSYCEGKLLEATSL